MYKKESHIRSILKGISWWIIATMMTVIITGTVLESFNEVALFLALTELIAKFTRYHFNERIWLRLPLGKIRN